MAKEVRTRLFGLVDPYANLVKLAFNNHGWAGNSPVFEKVITEIKPSLIVEVGSWMGQSARTMASVVRKLNLDAEIVCVDTFLGSFEHWDKTSYLMTLRNGRPNIYEQFLSNVIHADFQDIITPFPVDSINAYEYLNRAGIHPDMVYIDAAHDYESVKADLTRYSNLLKPGGVLLGDDFPHPPIKRAIADSLGEVEGMNEKYLWRKPL